MAEILVLTKEAPFPLQANGTTLRVNPVVRHLAKHHTVDLVLTADTRPDALDRAKEASVFCSSVASLPDAEVPRGVRLARTIVGLLDPRRPPWEFLDPFGAERIPVLTDLLRLRKYDVVYAVNEAFDLVTRLRHRGVLPPRVVIDWIDAPSLERARAAEKLTGFRARILRSRIRRIQQWQRQLNETVDAAIYIAEADLQHSGCADLPHVHVIPNGALRRNDAFVRSDDVPHTIGFLGNMEYPPNVLAAVRLHDQIFRPLAEVDPELRLKIIGRDPAPEVLDLAGARVEVTGEVDSIWPHLAEVDVMVFPMTLGAGLQNKVLEAVEAECAVVLTPVGAAGLGHEHQDKLIVRETDEEIRTAVRTLLNSPQALACARERGNAIRTAFDWEAILQRFESVVTGED